MAYRVVTIKQLGSNCWLVSRFIARSRCPRVFKCSYPELKTCKAVETEIAFQQARTQEITEQANAKVARLNAKTARLKVRGE